MTEDKYEYLNNKLNSITNYWGGNMMDKTEFNYDKKGRLIEKKFWGGKVNYNYDKRGRLIAETHYRDPDPDDPDPCCGGHDHDHEGCDHDHDHEEEHED